MQGGCNNICTPVQTTNERHIIEMICKQHRRKAQIRHGLPLRRCKISQQLRDCYMSNNTTLSVNLPRIIVPRRHADDRGWFSEIFHEKRLHDLGITCRFVQDNQAISKRAGTLRGLHFQLPPAAQAKLVTVVQGRIVGVAVDVRRGSPTFGKYVSTQLSAETGRQLYIPVGFAHGYLTLQDDVVLMYKVSDYYAPAYDGGICWNDPDIAIPWPFKDADIITSDKDRRLPLLNEFASPFAYDGHPLGALTDLNLG
jgi:dTDP-4-dehydrorhamnose 3,5-epimerase